VLPTAGTVPSEYQACRFSIDLAFGQSPPTAIGCCRIGNLHAVGLFGFRFEEGFGGAGDGPTLTPLLPAYAEQHRRGAGRGK
jgi:hypothetical protein